MNYGDVWTGSIHHLPPQLSQKSAVFHLQ